MSARIIIIGAGPAGCAAAVTLAQRGMDVTILESRPFPRVKVCGEFISPAATKILESLLTPAQLHAARAQTVQQFHVEHRDRAITWRMPHPAWVLSRATLDDHLLARARAAGARVIQPAAVREVCYVEHAVEVVTADAVLSADLVIHADGSGRHDPAGATPMRAGVIGRKCHLRIPGGVDGLRMRTGDGAYVGLVQVENGLATCALVARNHLVARHAGDGDALLSALWPAYRPEWRVGEWLSCGVAGSPYITPGQRRSFRVGNAAAAVEPVGGEGIGLALWSGWTLGCMLDPDDPGGTQRRMAAAYRARLRTRRPACRAAAEVLMRPALVDALWPLAGARATGARLIGAWYALSGKPRAA